MVITLVVLAQLEAVGVLVTNKKKRVMKFAEEGHWFAVPLREEGYGLCLVTRSNRKGICIGYFFGPKHKVLPDAKSVIDKIPEEALFVRRFGDLGIIEGDWPHIGIINNWKLDNWPIPVFGRLNDIGKTALAVRYNDNGGIAEEIAIEYELAKNLPSEGLLGAGAVELLLTAILI